MLLRSLLFACSLGSFLFSGCYSTWVTGDSASLKVGASSVDFGTVGVLSSGVSSITVSNYGETEARNISLSSLNGPFSYAGGSFPGNGGTCGTALASGTSCTLALQFTPTTSGSFSNGAQLNYDSGTEKIVVPVSLSGVSLPQGTTDPTFGPNANGAATLDLGEPESIRGITVRTDDAIIAVGDADSGAGTGRDISLIKFKANGIIDTSFGNSGVVSTAVGSGATDDFAVGAVIQSDNKVIVAVDSGNAMAIVRYRDDGTRDTSYGSSGNGLVPLTSIGLISDTPYGVILDSAGRALMVGESLNLTFPTTVSVGSVARISTSGSPELLFGALGGALVIYELLQKNQPRALGIQSTGKIIVAGSYRSGNSQNSGVIRIEPTLGLTDAAFNASTGKMLYDYCGFSRADEIIGVAIQPDNKIVLTGNCTDSVNGDTEIFIARLNDDGTKDTSFGVNGDGSITIDVAGGNDGASAVKIQSDGKILVSGYARVGGNDDFALIRLKTDGTKDTLFGTNGIGTFPIGSSDDRALAMDLQSNGKIILGGYSVGLSDQDFAILRLLQ